MWGLTQLAVLAVVQVTVLLVLTAASSVEEFVEKGPMANSLQQTLMLMAVLPYGQPSVLQQGCQQALWVNSCWVVHVIVALAPAAVVSGHYRFVNPLAVGSQSGEPSADLGAAVARQVATCSH